MKSSEIPKLGGMQPAAKTDILRLIGSCFLFATVLFLQPTWPIEMKQCLGDDAATSGMRHGADNLPKGRCILSNSTKTIRNLVFVFECHNGFTKQAAEYFRTLQASYPVCTKRSARPGEPPREVIELSDGSILDLEQVLQEVHTLGATRGASPVALKFAFRFICQNQAMSLRDSEILYFSGDESTADALACAQQFSGRSIPPTLSILGFSRGGARTIELAKELYARGIQVDLGVSIDPIEVSASTVLSIAWQYLGGRASTRRSYTIPKNVRWINFRQDIDNRWSANDWTPGSPALGLHGGEVPGAAIDRRIVPPGTAGISRNFAHWRLFLAPEVQATVTAELRSVWEKGAKR